MSRPLPPASASAPLVRDGQTETTRALAAETPVALVFNGTTQAVMMASPLDLEDFAYGFALSEGVVDHPDQIETLEVLPQEAGIEARMWIADTAAARLAQRRRAMMGPIGCGLCGIDSLTQVRRDLPPVTSDLRLTGTDISAAFAALSEAQPLHDATRSCHAAGFYVPGQGLTLAREDVGRHNALDKLIGAMARQGLSPGSGTIAMTSRLSVELVQKAALAGVPVLMGTSGASLLAVEVAQSARLTLIGFCRGDSFDAFCGTQRLA